MEKKNNTGALFPNTKKQKETHPDFTGMITINGKEMNLAAWKKVGSITDKPFLSIVISEKQVQEQPKQQSRPSYGKEFDDFLNGN